MIRKIKASFSSWLLAGILLVIVGLLMFYILLLPKPTADTASIKVNEFCLYAFAASSLALGCLLIYFRKKIDQWKKISDISKNDYWIILVLLLPSATCILSLVIPAAVTNVLTGVEREPVQVALSQVCSDGKGVVEAASYDPQSSNVHRIVILSANGEPHEWSTRLPYELFPRNVSEAELVACVGDQVEERIETCRYRDRFGGNTVTIERFQYRRSFQIREARTGKIVAQETVTSAPPECPIETQSGGSLSGPSLNYEWFIEYISSYVGGATSP